MRLTRVLNALAALLMGMMLLGCIIPMGWVHTSPDGQYVTVVRKPPDAPADSNDLELALYHIDRRQTTPVVRFSRDEDPPNPSFLYDCGWTPDSRAVYFTLLVGAKKPSSENGENGTANAAQGSELKPQVMLYEVASGRLIQLPIEVYLPRWSADGKYLMGLGWEESKPSIRIYHTDTWIHTQQVSLPEGWDIATFEWAHWLKSEPATAVIHLDAKRSSDAHGRNLYLLRGAQLIPLTTTGDVQAFWVDKTGVVLRWARVQSGKFLAVFERPLQGGAPRRVALVPYATIPEDAQVYGETFYRFSPDGQRLAWWTDYGVSVLEIATGVIRTLHAHKPKAADKTSTDGESWIFMFELKEPSIIGFDWRDAETLVIQGDLGHLELHSVRTFYP